MVQLLKKMIHMCNGGQARIYTLSSKNFDKSNFLMMTNELPENLVIKHFYNDDEYSCELSAMILLNQTYISYKLLAYNKNKLMLVYPKYDNFIPIDIVESCCDIARDLLCALEMNIYHR
jgi:hypothetical protein